MPAPFPIQETQVGAVAYVHGVMNNGTEITISGLASFVPTGDSITQSWTEKEKMDASGSTQNLILTNAKPERTIDVEVTGATRAAAAANWQFFTVGSSITVANHAVTVFNGAWRVKTGTKIDLKQDGEMTMSIPCEKWINTAQNAALTGAAIVG